GSARCHPRRPVPRCRQLLRAPSSRRPDGCYPQGRRRWVTNQFIRVGAVCRKKSGLALSLGAVAAGGRNREGKRQPAATIPQPSPLFRPPGTVMRREPSGRFVHIAPQPSDLTMNDSTVLLISRDPKLARSVEEGAGSASRLRLVTVPTLEGAAGA